MIYRMTEEEVVNRVLVDEANRLSRVLGTSSSIAAHNNIQALSITRSHAVFRDRWHEIGCKESSEKAILCYVSQLLWQCV